jgi:hypothetical protein
VARKSRDKEIQVLGILGVGLDSDDGHKRLTRAEQFLLVGGSQETHERMQDVAIQFNEALKERGKRLVDAEPREVVELLQRALER